jgi:hypothetical protein
MFDSITKKDIVLLVIGLFLTIVINMFNEEIVHFFKPPLMQLSYLMGSLPERWYYSFLADSYVSADSQVFNTLIKSNFYQLMSLIFFNLSFVLIRVKKFKKLKSEVDINNTAEDKKTIIKRSIFNWLGSIYESENYYFFMVVVGFLISLALIISSLNNATVSSRLFEFSKSVVLLKPYISEQKTSVLISDWVSMTSQKDYDQLQKKIETECKKYKIKCSK